MSVIPAQSDAVLAGMPKAIVCQEDETEEGNVCRASLQIRSDQYYSLVSHQKKQTGAMVSTDSRAAIEPTTSLSEGSFEELMQDENESLLKPLVKYKGCFSKRELDLCLAYLTEHLSNTENAANVKYPSMRLSIALTAEKRKAIEYLKARGVNYYKLEPYEGSRPSSRIKRWQSP